MIRISAKKTLTILEYILNNSLFSQTGIKDQTKSSIGLVNKIVNWLIDKQFVVKSGTRYQLVQPNRLVELIAIQTTTKKIKTYEVDLEKDEAKKLILKNKGIFCLDSALEGVKDKISKDNSTEDIYIYEPEKRLQDILDKTPRGNQKIHIFSSDLESEKTYKHTTDTLRTIIDFCSLNEHSKIEKIALDKWGTLQ